MVRGDAPLRNPSGALAPRASVCCGRRHAARMVRGRLAPARVVSPTAKFVQPNRAVGAAVRRLAYSFRSQRAIRNFGGTYDGFTARRASVARPQDFPGRGRRSGREPRVRRPHAARGRAGSAAHDRRRHGEDAIRQRARPAQGRRAAVLVRAVRRADGRCEPFHAAAETGRMVRRQGSLRGHLGRADGSRTAKSRRPSSRR